MEESIRSLRNFIDRIDKKIVQLLQKRIHYAKKLRKYKKIPYDPFREKEILEKMENRKFLGVFREIISLCRGEEGRFKIFIPEDDLYPFILKRFFGEKVNCEVLKSEEGCLEKAKKKKGFAFLEMKMKNLLNIQKKNLKILWLGSMEIKGKRKRFLLAGKELNENISKFPAFVMMVKKEKNKLLFFERKVEDAEKLKKLDKSSIIGIYPMEEKI